MRIHGRAQHSREAGAAAGEGEGEMEPTDRRENQEHMKQGTVLHFNELLTLKHVALVLADF